MINSSFLNFKADVALDSYLSLIKLLNVSLNSLPHENYFPISEGIVLDKRIFVEARKIVRDKDSIYDNLFTNVRGQIMDQKWDKKDYQMIAGDSFEAFMDKVNDSKLELILMLHQYLKLFLGKSENIEYKLALSKLIDHISSYDILYTIILSWVSNSIFNTPKTKHELFKEAKYCYENTLKQKSPIYEIKNGSFVQSSMKLDKHSDFQVFTLYDKILTKVTKVKSEISCQFYTKSLDLSKPIDNNTLENTKSIDLYYDLGFDETKKYSQDNIHLTMTEDGYFLGLEFWGCDYMIDFFLDFKKKSLFPLVDDMLKPILKTNDSSFGTDYKALIASIFFNRLRTTYNKSEVTDHKIKNVTGYFLVELGLLTSKDEYLDSDSKGSYNKYLRQNIENLLKKREKSKLLNFRSFADYNIEKMNKWAKLTPNNPFTLRKVD